MIDTSAPVKTTAVIGRRDYGWGVTAEIVTVGRDTYAIFADGLHKFCGKCGDGSGSIPCYGHVYAGVCFACGGHGVNAKAFKSVEHVEKLQAAADKRAAAAAEKRAAEWAAKQPERDAKERSDAEYEAHRENDRINAAAATRFAGQIGEKITVTGVVAVSLFLEAQQYGWSSSRMVVVEGTGEDAGIIVKVTSSGQALYGLDRGDVITISGTVKAHAVYQDKSQTVIQRPKVA